jgi:hypothetical protein
MKPDLIQKRELAHELIDRMPETQLSALVTFLETFVDPVTAEGSTS